MIAGAAIDENIKKQIEKADTVVVIWSDEAAASP
jgi:hypothetical protein